MVTGLLEVVTIHQERMVWFTSFWFGLLEAFHLGFWIWGLVCGGDGGVCACVCEMKMAIEVVSAFPEFAGGG